MNDAPNLYCLIQTAMCPLTHIKLNSLRGLNTEPVESRVASALGRGCIP
jgi:hypothetical protein